MAYFSLGASCYSSVVFPFLFFELLFHLQALLNLVRPVLFCEDPRTIKFCTLHYYIKTKFD